MTERITELVEATDKLENMIINLAADRERAWAEVERLRRQLELNERSYTELSEKHESELRRFEEERAAMAAEREERAETDRKIELVGEKIRALLPLLAEAAPEHAQE